MDLTWIAFGGLAVLVLFLRMIKFAVRVIIVIVLMGAFFVWQAQAQELSVEVASDHIDITVGFTGSTIEVFGDRRDKDTDVAVFVTGPEKTITVWNKAQVMGAWINRHFALFKRQPGYYNYATSFDPSDTANYRDLMLQNRIGLEGLFQATDVRLSGSVTDKQRFIDALVANKQKSGVYPENAAEMKFLNAHFFRVKFKIPAAAPTGDYKIQSFLIKDGKVIEADIDDLKVEQVGLNAFVLHAAKQTSLVYAIFCIMLAMGAGWLVSAVRVRP